MKNKRDFITPPVADKTLSGVSDNTRSCAKDHPATLNFIWHRIEVLGQWSSVPNLGAVTRSSAFSCAKNNRMRFADQ